MLEFNVLQNRWVILALGAGLFSVFVVILFLVELWKPRSDELVGPDEGESSWQSVYTHIPWILILTYVGIVVYGIVYTIINSMNPPNW